jgi:hypothetical protein
VVTQPARYLLRSDLRCGTAAKIIEQGTLLPFVIDRRFEICLGVFDCILHQVTESDNFSRLEFRQFEFAARVSFAFPIERKRIQPSPNFFGVRSLLWIAMCSPAVHVSPDIHLSQAS